MAFVQINAEYAKSRNQRYEQNQRRMRFWHSAPVGVPRMVFGRDQEVVINGMNASMAFTAYKCKRRNELHDYKRKYPKNLTFVLKLTPIVRLKTAPTKTVGAFWIHS